MHVINVSKFSPAHDLLQISVRSELGVAMSVALSPLTIAIGHQAAEQVADELQGEPAVSALGIPPALGCARLSEAHWKLAKLITSNVEQITQREKENDAIN